MGSRRLGLVLLVGLAAGCATARRSTPEYAGVIGEIEKRTGLAFDPAAVRLARVEAYPGLTILHYLDLMRRVRISVRHGAGPSPIADLESTLGGIRRGKDDFRVVRRGTFEAPPAGAVPYVGYAYREGRWPLSGMLFHYPEPAGASPSFTSVNLIRLGGDLGPADMEPAVAAFRERPAGSRLPAGEAVLARAAGVSRIRMDPAVYEPVRAEVTPDLVFLSYRDRLRGDDLWIGLLPIKAEEQRPGRVGTMTDFVEMVRDGKEEFELLDELPKPGSFQGSVPLLRYRFREGNLEWFGLGSVFKWPVGGRQWVYCVNLVSRRSDLGPEDLVPVLSGLP